LKRNNSVIDRPKVGLMVWSPLSGGLLSGKYKRDLQGAKGD
jgi:aryl-alcohol dehydrogenase-like predicted oxidoreductase